MFIQSRTRWYKHTTCDSRSWMASWFPCLPVYSWLHRCRILLCASQAHVPPTQQCCNTSVVSTTMCGMMMWDGKQSNHIFRLLFKHGVSPCSANARRIRCQADLNSFRLAELEETTGTPPYYVDEDYPAGPGITEPLPEWSNWCGSESSTLENDVYVWRYALTVVQSNMSMHHYEPGHYGSHPRPQVADRGTPSRSGTRG